MSSPADLSVEVVPHRAAGAGIAAAGSLFVRGVAAAQIDLREAVDSIVEDDATLCLIWDAGAVVASFLLAARFLDAERRDVMTVYALAGVGAPRWAPLVERIAVERAELLDCDAVRFMGKSGWARLLPRCRIIERAGTLCTFERGLS